MDFINSINILQWFGLCIVFVAIVMVVLEFAEYIYDRIKNNKK